MKYKNFDNKASVLIGVLWSLFLLGALALAINAYIFPQITLAERLSIRPKLFYIAHAGVRRAMLEVVKEEKNKFDSLKESWGNNSGAFKEIEIPDGNFSIKYSPYPEKDISKTIYGLIDEERKININKCSKDILKRFFQLACDITEIESGIIADSIADWTDTDEEIRENGAESGYYLNLSHPYKSKNKNFELVEELLLIKGITPEIFDKIKDHVTVFGKGSININTANTLVLQSLGMGPTLAKKIVDFRNGSDGIAGTQDDNIFDNLENILKNVGNSQGFTKVEADELRQVLSLGVLGLISDFYMGHSYAQLNDKKNSTKIVFIFDRDKVIRYWKQE